jgi:CRP/FNR family transcriptional regulator
MHASLDTILFLKDVSLFDTLTNPQLTEVARLAESCELQRGKPLFMAGDTVDYFYIVRAGLLRVVKGDSEVARIGPGECVGEMAVLAGTDRTATVEAVDDTRLLRFDAEDFLALLETYTEIGRGLLRALVRRLAAQTRAAHPADPRA